MKSLQYFAIILVFLFGLGMITLATQAQPDGKINGISIISPEKPTNQGFIQPINRVNANWVAIIPYAACFPGDPKIYYNNVYNSWGDTPEGIRHVAQLAKKQGLKVLLKPHIWVVNQGWPGNFDLGYIVWEEWEKNYRSFIIEMVEIAEEEDIEMFCMGTEFRTAANKHPDFWSHLADTLRYYFSGDITYAANWDNYDNIAFWNKLDYIGLDAYFPLTENETPTTEELVTNWSEYESQLENFAKKINKKIIFSEFGYRSNNQPAWNQWEIENISAVNKINSTAQSNAYQALFEVFWDNPWFAGGFAWKWYPQDQTAGDIRDAGFSPNNEPLEEVIRLYYTGRGRRF